MTRAVSAVLAIFLLLSGAVAVAQIVEPEKPAVAPNLDTENGRYVFNKQADSYVRLDMRTGQVSVCSQRTVGWTCQVAPDDRALLETEISRLRTENALLKKEMLARNVPLPNTVRPDTIRPDAGQGLKVPSDAELDKVMATVEKAWRRLVDIMMSVQKDLSR